MKKPAAINTVIGTGIFLSIPLIFVTTRSNFAEAAKLFLSYPYWVFILFYLGVYFLLSKIVLPQLYFKGKFLALFFVLTGLLALAFFIKPFDGLIHHTQNERPAKRFNDAELFPGQREMPGPRPPMDGERQRMTPIFDFVSIFLLMMVCLIVVVDEAVKKSRLTERRAIQAEADKANAELSFLKAQINPHFLFNTLNNIYSLAVTKSDNAPDAIMKLSNIMRYITDEANETMVPLDDEISCINDYISLQKLRLGENFPIDFSVSGSTVGKIIPPLVLMTFVENAFKHGISNHEQSNILLKIVVQDKYIHFFAQNNLFAKPRNTERTGVGITNTKKRLQVLYAEKHLLMITEEKGMYAVELILYS